MCSHILRATAGRKPGLITHVGLKTYADPRREACKGNDAARNCGHEVVQLLEIDGKEYMCYKSVPLDICFLRGTYADEAGNISMVKEAVHGEMCIRDRKHSAEEIKQLQKLIWKAEPPKRHSFCGDEMENRLLLIVPRGHEETVLKQAESIPETHGRVMTGGCLVTTKNLEKVRQIRTFQAVLFDFYPAPIPSLDGATRCV